MAARRVSIKLSLRTDLPLLLCAPLLVSCGGLMQPESTTESRSAVTTATITLTAPQGMSVLAPAVVSATSLQLQPFAKVMPSAPAVAMGSSDATVAQPDIQLNDLWSRGPVTLKERATILGVIHAKSLTLQNMTLPASKKDSNPVFDPISTLSWTVTYPTTAPATVLLNPPDRMRIEPGVYSSITLNSPRGTTPAPELTFASGTYYVGTLALQSDAKVWLDQSSGPVVIYASTVFGLRSSIATLDGSLPDLFLGYLGTNPLYVETKFIGAIVAPFGNLTIRTVTGGHTGFFAGKSILLDANAVVNYRAPNVIALVAKPPTQSACRDLVQKRTDLTGDEQQAAYIADLARYCGCIPTEDTDGDGTSDCLDGCPYDPLKTTPGTSGCGAACTSIVDSDLDGTRDCLDGCPYDATKTAPGIAGCGHSDFPKIPGGIVPVFTQCAYDPNNVEPGDCGCIGEANLKPAGTRCFDPDCPNQIKPVCDGQGQCGGSCDPVSNGGCRHITLQGHTYFFCGGTTPPGGTTAPPKTQQGAYDACYAKGLAMARIDTYDQNTRIRDLLKSLGIARAWLGGNQRTTSGVWRWAKLGSFDGDQFWSGGSSGASVDNRLAFWSLGHPGTQKCLAIQSSDGRWIDNNCVETLPYVCENPPSTIAGGGGTGTGSSTGSPSVPRQPVPISSTICVPNGSGPASLPVNTAAGLAQLYDEYTQANSGTYVGIAASPPTGANCLASELTQNCPLKDVKTLPCDDPSTPMAECDCATENAKRFPVDPDICEEQFGSGYVCLSSKDDPTCLILDPDSAESCHLTAHCGIPDCTATAPKHTGQCDQIDVCPDPADEYKFTDLDSTDPLTADTITPNQFFASQPDTKQSAEYVDKPPTSPAGKDHPWCRLGPQDATKVQPASTNMDKQGASGGDSPLKVTFSPDLIFDANVDPLAFGQSKMGLHAKAFMGASVALQKKPLVTSKIEFEIFHAGVEATVNRCRVQTGSDFVVFNVPISLDAWIKRIDTDSDAPANAAIKAQGIICNNAVEDFTLKADRVKKAFRDAQQLLSQYKDAKANGKVLGPDLCKELGVEQLANKDFALAGVCPEGEAPETTINRFVNFYQQDGRGELSKLTAAASDLATKGRALGDALKASLGVGDGADFSIRFADFKRSESHTVVKTPFAIGPVPMVLEIAAVAGYGVNGEFRLNLSFPTDIFNPIGNLQSDPNIAPSPEQVARVGAVVEPWASAGLTIFVGANFVIGSVGIEGALTLAKVSAPIIAGVGLAVASTPDTRAIPVDIASVSALDGAAPRLVFKDRKSYQFYFTYDYGASVRLTDVLSGEINGRLTIDFWLFSRTWRQRIVKFAGWSNEFPLVSATGGSVARVTLPGGAQNNTSSGLTGMGLSESPLPFTYLELLRLPEVVNTILDTVDDGAAGAAGAAGASAMGGGGGAGSGPSVSPVDKTKVEQFSYDTLCCSGVGDGCMKVGRPSCCPNLVCDGATDTTPGTCAPKPAPACAADGAMCGLDPATGDVITCCSLLDCPINGRCPESCIEIWQPCVPGGTPCCGKPPLPCDNFGGYGYFCNGMS